MITIDGWKIESVVNGGLRLDGGAMFGVVPQTLWRRQTLPDEQNRITLATRTLVAVSQDDQRVVLVDTGCGSKWAPDKAERFAIEYHENAIPDGLRALGKSVEDVTDVVVTHLHFDHNGGVTVWKGEPGGATKLRYPHARHWIHEQHLEHARAPHLKDKASFIAPDFATLREMSNLGLVRGENPEPPFDGVSWFVSHGHTPYQLHPIFGNGAERLLFVGDVIPTSMHLPPAWIMAYDVAPMTTIDEKRRLYRQCIEDGMLLAFPHDPSIGITRVAGTVDRPKLCVVAG